MFRGCPAPVWEDLAQKSLLDLIAHSSSDELVQCESLSTLLWNLFLVDHVVAFSTESLVSALALSLESCLSCLQPSHVS